MRPAKPSSRTALANLVKIARIKSDFELGKLGKLMDDGMDVRRRVTKTKAEYTNAVAAADLRFLIQCGTKLERLAENNLRALGIEEARIRADIEVQRPKAHRAFGKANVIEKLLKS